jgi:putative FmdB family regulatory protein
MPVYEYRCKACGRTHEIEHGFHDARPTSCPECGGPLSRVFHPVGVVFKGSGFHKTDYKKSTVKETGAKTEAASTEASTKSTSDGKPAGESKSAVPKPSATDSGKKP